MQKPRGQYRACCANWMTMRDGPTFNIDNILGQAKVVGHSNGDCSECLVDLDSLNIGHFPVSPSECLLDSGDGTQPEHPGFNSTDSIGNKAGHRFEPLCV